MNVKLLRTKKIVLFHEDEIFYPAIINNTKTIHDAYSFQSIKKDDENNSISFHNGLVVKGNTQIFIEALAIVGRKIILSTNQKTETTYEVLYEIMNLLLERGALMTITPIIETYETTTVIESSFSIDDIFSKFMLSTFFSTVAECSTDIENAPNLSKKTNGNSIKLLVSYEDHGSYYKKKGITVNDKYFTIEKRRDTDSNDNVLFASSPFSYEEHMKILDSLEKYAASAEIAT